MASDLGCSSDLSLWHEIAIRSVWHAVLCRNAGRQLSGTLPEQAAAVQLENSC